MNRIAPWGTAGNWVRGCELDSVRQKVGSILIASLLSIGRAEPADEQPRTNQQPVTTAAVVTGEAKRSSPAPLAPVYAMALAGDLQEGLRILESVPVETLNSSERTARENLLRTFVEKKLPPIAVPDPFVAELIGIYRDYWMRVLLRELNVAEGKEYLFKRLTAILGQAGYHKQYHTLEKLSDEVGRILRRKGFYSLRGVTQPYYELMVWGKETARIYRVELPETTIKVKVVFMRDFATLGWSAFATCGKAYSGGWARKDSLYCVADAYDPASKSFAVSYLAHEAQHFADYRRFPKLEQPELEYRAKLVELILANETARAVLTGFASQTGRSRSAPHNFANLRLFTDVSRSILGGDTPVTDPERWSGVSDQDISRAARVLLERNTKSLVARGARQVSRVLEESVP